LRRYLPTLILILGLLVLGGVTIYRTFNEPSPFQGYYVPTLSPDPEAGQLQALILVVGVVVLVGLTMGTGVGLAFAFYYVTKMLAARPGQETTARTETARPASAASAAGEAPRPPLSDTRELAVFWAGFTVIVVGFMALRLMNQPVGYVPNLLITAAPQPSPPPTRPPGGAAVSQADLDALPPGDATAGQNVFTAAGCAACHSLEPEVKVVGPSLAGVATRAAARRPGYSAELYLYESMVQPNAYVVDGFQPDVMPRTFQETLTPQNLADLIAFLLTLE
jgi:mono/diheme cytochrome c family protein